MQLYKMPKNFCRTENMINHVKQLAGANISSMFDQGWQKTPKNSFKRKKRGE